MSKVIKVDLHQWNDHMQQLGKRFMPAAQRGVMAGAARAVPELQKRTSRAPPASARGSTGAVDTGLYKMAWRSSSIPNGARVYNMRPYSGVIEHGRRAGPVGVDGIRNLTAWASRKLKLSGREAKKAAYAIARSMRNRALKARKVLTGDEKKLIKIVEKEILHELDVELGRK